jgi:starch-binding outer membrane protein, SusD/RagB family
MKKILSLLFISVTLVLAFSGCEKIINKTPDMLLPTETALTSVEGLQSAINGMYNSLQSSQLYGGNIWVAQDMLANNVAPSGQGNIVYEENQMLQKGMSPDNLISASFWGDSYYTINLANQILEAIPNVAPPASLANEMRGECLFVRSLIYFEMVRFLGNPSNGLGVPLVLSPTGIYGKPARALTEDVYSSIINDLLEAETLLGTENDKLTTVWAVKALLSRVYFYHGDMQSCIDVSTDVIENGGFSLTDSIMDNFNTTSLPVTSEIIFAVLSTQTNTTAGPLYSYYAVASNGKFSPSVQTLKIFTFTGGLQDQRYRDFFVKVGVKYFVTLFDNRYINIPEIRLAEIYLNRGEARFDMGDAAGALADLNVVRKRAGVPDTTSLSSLAFYYERAKELAFQGDNFFNQKRLHRQKISDQQLPWDSERLLYLVPQREMDVNPNLVQN